MNKPILDKSLSITRGALPGSRKLMVAHGNFSVPFREVSLSGGEPRRLKTPAGTSTTNERRPARRGRHAGRNARQAAGLTTLFRRWTVRMSLTQTISIGQPEIAGRRREGRPSKGCEIYDHARPGRAAISDLERTVVSRYTSKV